MAFTTLAQRFEQRSKDIYGKLAPSSDQPVVVKIDTDGVFGSRSRIVSDTRALPVVSTIRDAKRIGSFLTSPEGVLYTAKQLLLQTGNTFSTTKTYNPLTPIIHTVPFIHKSRHIRRGTAESNPSGLLQNATVTNINNKFNVASGKTGAIWQTISTQLKNFHETIVPKAQKYYESRPEYKVFGLSQDGQKKLMRGPFLSARQPLKDRGQKHVGKTQAKNVASVQIALTSPTVPVVVVQPSETPTSFAESAAKFRKSFYSRNVEENRFLNPYLDNKNIPINSETAGDVPLENLQPRARASLADEYNSKIYTPDNILSNTPPVPRGTLTQGTSLPQGEPTETQKKTDIITFKFKNDGIAVPFRAFISTIKESIKPEFAEQRYVGRTERFVTYSGTKRGLSLAFNVVAFAEEEMDSVWKRINYLTGLTYPKGVVNGFMVPPLFTVTVGKIYDNQPCYIESLDYDLLDESTTFDIDREVPFMVAVTMQLSILEKRSKFYTSPFYKITEDLVNSQ